MLGAILYHIKRLLPDNKLIVNIDDLEQYLSEECGRMAGGLVMSYAQKRAGRLHWKLVKEEEYARDLINTQIILHAEIISDIAFLTSDLLQLDRKDTKKTLTAMIGRIHAKYVSSTPMQGVMDSALKPHHFMPKEQGIRDFSVKSGKKLFASLPMTDNLLKDNSKIFEGQLRSKYIALLQRLDRKMVKDQLKMALSS